MRKNPTNDALLYSLALSYLHLSKYDSAIRWFSYGLRLNPRWIDGLCGVAAAYFNMKKFDKAMYYIELAKNNFKSIKNKTVPHDPNDRAVFLSDELPSASRLSLYTITFI